MAWRHFRMSEFVCRCGCGLNDIEDEFVDMLDELRARVGFPLQVSSGFRCPDHNERVSSTGRTGPHTTGWAADLLVARERAVTVLQEALYMDFTGFGLNQKGAVRFIHLDALSDAQGRPRPTIWTY